jgi:tetratricopeptide (TPR) repeat protein
MKTTRKLQLAIDAIKGNRPEEAIGILQALLAHMPDNQQARWMLAECLDARNDVEGAQQHLVEFLRNAPDDLNLIDQVASQLLSRARPLQPALDAYRSYLERKPDAAGAVFNYAWYLAKDEQFEAAVEMYRRALELGIDSPEEVHLNIANLCMDHLADDELARKHLLEAIELRPGYFGAHYNLGNLAEQDGDRAGAAAHFEICLESDPGNETALARLGDVHRFTMADDPLLEWMAETAQTSRNSDLHFALGRAYDSLSDFDKAWQHMSRANALDEEAQPRYEAGASQDRIDRIISQCSADWLSSFGEQSHRPVFICGMFRTGSTLVEQMLAAHPSFAAGGEQEFFPRLVARDFPGYPDGLDSIPGEKISEWREQHAMLSRRLAGAGRLTDKRPDNFLCIGLIKAILPSAQFVVTERDWRDAAVSIFGTRLGPSQAYATRLEDIRHYLGLQRRLIDHWASLLGEDLFRVRYEDLVLQPRETLEGVLQALGEEWDERCLAFDTLDNKVRTASAWQVRQPLHSKSIGRWKNYRRPLEEAFGRDLAD